ncbi:glutamate receptor 2.7-like [Pyrus ussuriensis x Pyrus communis]|uniref:Glutamate receptor 2.7-like n=1 Tax=Pyrus ussuriensis x Pyrus communis TaxID=2448454 RepID=A0A5N5FSP7_9ROSA|nr:glutamate receptor 2.7-like [Pyrus ussuriensis x Pyrus communis]
MWGRLDQNKMSFPFPKLGLLLPVLIVCLLIAISHGVGANNSSNVTNIGAIINANGRIGKEQKTAMEIAAENFNNCSKTHKLVLHFRDSGRDPFRASSAVADRAGNQSNVSVISFSSTAITQPLIQSRWPYLIRMATDGSAQLKCIADMVSAYNWKRVVVVYEDDGHGGAVGMLAVLSEALRDVGSKIQHHLILLRVSSMSNPNWDELEEILSLPTIQSRVFIVIQSSFPTVTHLFCVAKKMGLVGRDSAWIITESVISDFPDSLDNSDMDGTLGIKTYYANNSSSCTKFLKELETKFSDEDNTAPMPGIYALQAYDMMTVIAQAITIMTSNNSATTSSSLQVLLNILLNNCTGLSGKMYFKEGEVRFYSPRFRIINVVDGKIHRDVGFSESVVRQGTNRRNDAMPTSEKPMKILVPGVTYFNKFVKVDWSWHNSDEKKFDVSKLNYSLPNKIEASNDTYDSVIELVQNKDYDAVIVDVTVLPDQLDRVDFTQTYIESGLSMIVPEKYEESTWLCLKPFTWQVWVASGGLLLYTTLIVCGLKNQIGTATRFTFSSLFFAHREKICNNLARVVVIEWLFVVLIPSSSYTANLSSILTIKRIEPNVIDTEMLKRTEARVGSTADSLVRNYMLNVIGFRNANIIEIDPQHNVDYFKSKHLSAVFLELPFAEVLINQNCKGYTRTAPTYRFGGFSFAFQKGSPIARDFTRVILKLLEHGELKELQHKWLTPKEEKCSRNATSDIPESLNLKNFSGLYIITGVTSTFCFLISLVILLRQFGERKMEQGNASPSDESIWKRTVRITGYIKRILRLRWNNTVASNIPDHPQALMSPPETEGISEELIEQRQ